MGHCTVAHIIRIVWRNNKKQFAGLSDILGHILVNLATDNMIHFCETVAHTRLWSDAALFIQMIFSCCVVVLGSSLGHFPIRPGHWSVIEDETTDDGDSDLKVPCRWWSAQPSDWTGPVGALLLARGWRTNRVGGESSSASDKVIMLSVSVQPLCCEFLK